jgi:glycosyltransferase involved in cell wall biosynthesis
MNILMVNKFLYPNGGSETYMFKVGDYLASAGHQVEYFGMEHEGRIVGNRAGSYTSNIDFHSGQMAKLLYPFKIVYSAEARQKIKKVLNDLQPDVVHLNNFNFQITPSILYEIRQFTARHKKDVRIIYTAHDYQLICPNHMLRNPRTRQNCEKCIGGRFYSCTMDKCIHGSALRSLLGSVEAYLYKTLKTYQFIDTIICPSHFMEGKMLTNKLFMGKTVVLHNSIDHVLPDQNDKEDFVLYFGRYSEEKGFRTLLDACRKLPDIPFVFAGKGPLEADIAGIQNIRNVGFQNRAALESLVRKARFSVYPSEWYENCPFSVMESQMFGTPVIGADIGGIPELIEVGKTGELFMSGDNDDLKEKIGNLWHDRDKCRAYAQNCAHLKFDVIDEYCRKLADIYHGSVNTSNQM